MGLRRRSTVPVFVDTSAYFAFAVPQDTDHVRAGILFRRLAGRPYSFVTTPLIVAETHVLLKSRLERRVTPLHARAIARQAIEGIYRSGVLIETVTPSDQQAAVALLAQYADQDFSYTDATSFTVMRRLGISLAFTFDGDFTAAGFTDLRHTLTK
jgi:Predicted nucleic acid-binding protein, contains PIN domain